MSTRGAVGIRFNEIDKIGYNHCDSYPKNGLGDSILTFLKNHSIEQLKNIYNNIVFSDDSEEWAWDWDNDCFNLTFYDSSQFLINSLCCEYAYIINLDTECLEFYNGFNTNPCELGRYANIKSDIKLDDMPTYYGVKLVQIIPLSHINNYETYEDDTMTGFKSIIS